MSSSGKRSMFLVCVGAISVPLVAAALAYGCTAVATLQLSRSAATAGSTVAVSGKYFGTHDPGADSTNGRAEIRVGSLTGPVLATAAPSGPEQSFTVQVSIPSGTPSGATFLAATQKRATGTNVYGTPARQAFTVLAPAASAGGSGGATNKVATTIVPEDVVDTLSLAEARRSAKMRVKRSSPGAKGIRAKCSRRSRTTATCRVRWSSKGKSRSKKLVVKSQSSSSAW